MKSETALHTACVGVAIKPAYLLKQETLSHQFVTDEAHKRKNKTAVEALTDIGNPPYCDIVKGMAVKYSWMWKSGGMIEGETGPFPAPPTFSPSISLIENAIC